jgi:hypothetical protein
MNDLSPLLSGTPDELEALLLRSADDDEPSGDALEQAGLALGLGASALAAMSASSALTSQAALATSGAALTNAALAKPLTLLSLAKWLGVGLAAGLVTSGVAHVATRAPAAPPAMTFEAPMAAPAEGPRVARATATAPVPLVAKAAEDPPPAAPALAAAVPPAPAVTVETAPGPAPIPPADAPPRPSSASFAPLEEAPASVQASPGSTLGEETRALDRVREHLAAGRPGQALVEIDRYRAQWTRGALAAEAALLRVDALLRAGNRHAAELEANALIARAPQSRYATRARSLLGDSPR